MQHRHKLMKRCEESSCCCCASKSESEKTAAQGETIAINETQSAVEKTDENPTALDPKKAAVAAAIARAKAKESRRSR